MPSTSPTLRTRVEGFSRPLLVRLSGMPRLAILIGTLALVVVGLLAPLPVALAALVVVFAFVVWIAYLSWPVVGTGGKVARLAMLALIVVLAATRF